MCSYMKSYPQTGMCTILSIKIKLKKKVFIEEKLSLSWDVHYFGLILSTSTIKGQSPEFIDQEVWLLTALPSAKGT